MASIPPIEPLFNPLVEHAIELSAQWHDRTYRKSRWREAAFDVPDDEVLLVPVMAHLTAVAMTVQRAGWDDETVAAAFLHDALEDLNRFEGKMRREELASLVGPEVTRRVVGVTERKIDDEGRWIRWRPRKEAYVEGIRTAPPEVAAISLADKLHNLWTINEAVASGIDVFADGPHRRPLSAGPPEQRWFYEAVLEATEPHQDTRLEPMRQALRAEIERFGRLTDQA